MHLKWRNSSHHPEVINHEETVARQSIQTSAGEPARGQEVSVDVEVRKAARECVELVLHLEGPQVPKGHLFLI